MRQKNENSTNPVARTFVIAALLLINGAFAQGALAAAEQKANADYTWSAELVSFDPGSHMLTLKSRIETYADKKPLANLSEGQAITLTWTGMTWGAGIRAIAPRGASAAAADAITLPAEFVRTELDDGYVVYRVQVPASATAKIGALKPGAWVTGMSPRHATDPQSAILDVHPFTTAK